jgi:hypothetical protein
MLFLAPTTLALAAALTVPTLLAIYMLKLRRRPVRVSTTQFWPQASQDVQANIPLRLIRPSLLLFLHLLILGLFLAALGRPAIMDDSGAGSRVVLILDTSASMAAADTQPTTTTISTTTTTRLDAAKARAREITDSVLASGGEIATVALGKEATILSGFSSSRRIVREALDRATQTDEPGDLAQTLRVVEAMALDAEDETRPPPTAILLSDGSFAPSTEPARSAARVRFERIGPPLPSETQSTTLTASPLPSHSNTGIIGLAAARDSDDPALVRLFVEVINASQTAADIPLSISIDGQVVARSIINVKGTNPDSTPGRASTTIPLRAPSGGVVLASLNTTDLLTSDNAAALTLDAPSRPIIWLVTRAASPGDTLLRKALEELRPQRLDVIDEREYTLRLRTQADAQANLIVLSSIRSPRTPLAPTLSFAAPPPLPGLEVTGLTEGSRATFWDREHPLLRNVSLDSLVVASLLRVTLAPSLKAKQVARGSEGPTIIIAEHAGLRHVAILFDLDQSNWPILLGFPIFLADATDFLTLRGEASSGRWFRTGAPASLRARATTSPTRIALEGPEPREIELPAASPADAALRTVPIGAFARAGIYIARGDALIDRALAINLADATESALRAPATLDIGGRRIEVGAGVRQPRELWWWFVLAGGALLIIEWLVYAWKTRV